MVLGDRSALIWMPPIPATEELLAIAEEFFKCSKLPNCHHKLERSWPW
jgi:hypothetical protein